MAHIRQEVHQGRNWVWAVASSPPKYDLAKVLAVVSSNFPDQAWKLGAQKLP